MTDNLSPNCPSSDPASFANSNQLSATNSQIGDVVQVSGSPGAIVNQTINQVQASPVLGRTDLIFWLLMALVVLAVSSRATINIGLPSVVGQMITGALLAGIVWKFFERVQAVLNEDTKLEIAVWLMGVELSKNVEFWPNNFVEMFDRVFGGEYSSGKRFRRSLLASFTVGPLAWFLFSIHAGTLEEWAMIGLLVIMCNALPDYLCLIKTRFLIGQMRDRNRLSIAILLAFDLVTTFVIAFIPTTLLMVDSESHGHPIDLDHWIHGTILAWLCPAYISSIWLWLYAGSGFILKAAQRFDIGFKWFNAKFDIENKPLQAIGLVAGALVALAYWAVVIAGHFIK
jgi:hypothetical protein